MARPFAYNPSLTPIEGTEQIGDIAIGVSATDYSLAATGVFWWMGPDETTGYVIAKSVPTGNQPFNPSIGATAAYVGFSRSETLTEASFVELANNIASGASSWGPTGGSSAKAWLNANGYWTSWGNVVTNDLTMRIDASNSSSYPGSGTTWFDLAGTQDNITLVGSPVYTAAAPSYFTFNGSTQFGTGSSNNVVPQTSYTKSVWFYLNAYADNNLVSSGDGGHFLYFGSASNRIYSGHSNWGNFQAYPSTATINLNTWYCATLTFNTTDGMVLYINGIQDSTYTANKTAHNGNGQTNIATYADSGGNYLNGRIAKVYTYSRSLSGSEVLQNFNADKSQFGM